MPVWAVTPPYKGRLLPVPVVTPPYVTVGRNNTEHSECPRKRGGGLSLRLAFKFGPGPGHEYGLAAHSGWHPDRGTARDP